MATKWCPSPNSEVKVKKIRERSNKVLRSLWYFTLILIELKKFAKLLPNYWLAETPQALAPRRLCRQSAERERISEIN
ncbi:hypothetical protein [Peribacillus simplex]|uniref:hypothetical protein n=1 Tax=Peribacillus simplex TaxID=1478 RepID=UPI003672780A